MYIWNEFCELVVFLISLSEFKCKFLNMVFMNVDFEYKVKIYNVVKDKIVWIIEICYLFELRKGELVVEYGWVMV